ncbi:MAG: DNA polymerase III subunit chi [Gammaproteobacteria bacterium]|nr:DNA polymerase III subunit chi [Gammaproteobacteria bacterium]
MQSSAQFRLLGNDNNWLEEITAQIYACAKKYRKLAVLCPDDERLTEVDERLWQNAAANFVSFAKADEAESSEVNVLLTTSLESIGRRPAVINLGADIAPSSLTMQHLCEIVLFEEEAIAKAREQYKMYRQQGFHLQHHELTKS